VIGAEKLRLAIRDLGKDTFTTPELNSPNMSARISDMLKTGEIVIVGELPVFKRKPLKVYKWVGLPDVVLPEKECNRTPIPGTRLREVRWNETHYVTKERPNYYPIPTQSLW